MSRPGELPPIDPALFPALYDSIPVVKDAAFWRERFEALRDTVLSIVRSPSTPMTKLAILEDTIREQYKQGV